MIVGALALPWMLLLVDLFCPEREQLNHRLLELLNNTALAAAAGTVALSLAYFVGASVGRVADDFSNDDDLHLPVTEDAIRTSVYCAPSQPWLIHTGARLAATTKAAPASPHRALLLRSPPQLTPTSTAPPMATTVSARFSPSRKSHCS
jgi:hypothetical protein